MSQRIKRSIQPWKIIVAPLFLWGALVAVGYSDGGGNHNDGGELTGIDTTGKSDEELAKFSASLDSVYAVVGAAYKTVEPMLRASCYDCHSSQTVFPWYHAIPGIKQMIDSDIKEGREHLDLDKGFPVEGHANQLDQLKEMREEVEEGEMPPFSYTIIHWDTKIEGDQRRKLFGWIDQSSDAIKEVYSRYQIELPKENEHNAGADSDDDDDNGHDEDDD